MHGGTMSGRILIAALLAAVPLGCKKTKFTGATDSPAASPGSHGVSGDKGKPGDKDKDKNKKDGEANWLTDPRFKKDTERPSGSGTDSGGLPGKPGIGIAMPEGGFGESGNGGTTGTPSKPSTPAGTPSPPASPTGKTPATPAPATGTPSGSGRSVSEANMKDVWVFIDNRSGATGQMPSMRDVYDALATAKSPAAYLVKDGSIVLTNSRSRDSVWAYEKNAPLNGGLVAGSNGVERLSADQLKGRLR